MKNRKDTLKVFVKDIPIGGKSNIVIQTMTTTKTKNIKETVQRNCDSNKYFSYCWSANSKTSSS